MSLILSTIFLMFAVSSIRVSVYAVALNLALQFEHSYSPMVIFGASPFFDGCRVEIGHVLTGTDTLFPHFGHLTML